LSKWYEPLFCRNDSRSLLGVEASSFSLKCGKFIRFGGQVRFRLFD